MGTIRLLAAGAATLGLLFSSTTTASALTATASCSAKEYNLNASASYKKKGIYHQWSMAYWNLNGPNLGNKNNISIRLTANGVQKWAYTSSDSIPRGNGHTGMRPAETLAGAKEKITWTAVFDVPGPDPRCTAERGGI